MAAKYYLNKTVDQPLDEATTNVLNALQEEGFGVLTEIDVQATFKKKLDVDYHPYVILGACNPGFAYQALQADDKIGTMLPCNVIVQQVGEGKTEVIAIDPVASMQAVKNDQLFALAEEVRECLGRVIDAL